MSKPLPFTQSALPCAIRGAQKEGLRVIAITPDGMVVVDEGNGPHPYADPEVEKLSR